MPACNQKELSQNITIVDPGASTKELVKMMREMVPDDKKQEIVEFQINPFKAPLT